jgi:signal peptidase I
MKMRKPSRFYLAAILPVVAVLRLVSPLTATVVEGHSMEPTLHPGDVRLLQRGYYRSHPLSRGDVVVLRLGGETYVKRVYALPGDQLWLLHFAEDDRNEILVPAAAARLRRAQEDGYPTGGRVMLRTIPPGYCFVLGDNAAVSMDSRDFGPVPESAIMGRVML